MAVQVIPQDEGAFNQELQLHQVSQFVETEEIFLWLPAEKSADEMGNMLKVEEHKAVHFLGIVQITSKTVRGTELWVKGSLKGQRSSTMTWDTD